MFGDSINNFFVMKSYIVAEDWDHTKRFYLYLSTINGKFCLFVA